MPLPFGHQPVHSDSEEAAAAFAYHAVYKDGFAAPGRSIQQDAIAPLTLKIFGIGKTFHDRPFKHDLCAIHVNKITPLWNVVGNLYLEAVNDTHDVVRIARSMYFGQLSTGAGIPHD